MTPRDLAPGASLVLALALLAGACSTGKPAPAPAAPARAPSEARVPPSAPAPPAVRGTPASPSPSTPPATGTAASPSSFPDPAPPTIDVGLTSSAATYLVPDGWWLLRSGGPGGAVERICGPLLLSASTGGKIAAGEREARRDLASPVEVAPAGASLLPWGDARYRGTMRLLANGRGALTLVNRVGLEDYLRGVVPAEMGPRVYDELEALKSQAVAARSYAVRHRGESAAEGYDLCATPKCQAYGGASAEHPLSTRAVEETAGEVLAFGGQVADTLFTSTCGGRTEDARNVFTTWAADDKPYLSSVACSGEKPLSVATSLPPGAGASTFLGVRGHALLAALGRSGTAWADLVAARGALRERLGLPPGGGPKTLQPAAVYADLGRATGLLEADLLLEEGEATAAAAATGPAAPEGPAAWPEEARVSLALARRFQLGGQTPLPVTRAFRPAEAAGLWAALLARLGEVEEIEARVVSTGPDGLVVKGPKGRVTFPLVAAPALFVGSGDEWTGVSALAPYPGDRVRLLTWRGAVSGIALLLSGAPGQYERDSAWVHWIRRVSGPELMSRIRERDAGRKGTVVRKIEVLERGTSGRAKRARVTTDAGALVLSGLEIRFSFGIPENLFTVVPGRGEKGEPLFTFFGRGWGHGVGLCQNGAFGMALAGRGYREILSKYYAGAQVVPAASLTLAPPDRRVE